MRDCKTGAVQAIAQQWVNFMVAVRGVPALDQTRLAKSELEMAINSIRTTESSVRTELSSIASQVKRVDPHRAKVVMAGQLKRSRYLRQQLSVLENKRVSLQQHLDTLDTSELNQQVISSVKRTSSALKSLGLEAEQQQLDALFVDMEDRLHDMKTIQQSLSSPLDDSDYDAAALDQELEMLLHDDEDGYMASANGKKTYSTSKTHVEKPNGLSTATLVEVPNSMPPLDSMSEERQSLADQSEIKAETEGAVCESNVQSTQMTVKVKNKRGVRTNNVMETVVEA